MTQTGPATPGSIEIPLWAEGTDILVLNVRTGATRNLTGGTKDNWLPSWSPDGRYLAFLSDRDGAGRARLWVWTPLDDKLREVSRMDLRTNQMEWTPDSKQVLATSSQSRVDLEAAPKNRLSEGTCENRGYAPSGDGNPTAVVYKSDSCTAGTTVRSDPWDLNRDFGDLVFLTVEDGTASTIVHGQRIGSFALSPDGSRVAYTIPRKFEKPGSQQILFDVAVVERGTGKEQILASDVRLNYDGASFAWAPDSRSISYRTAGMAERTSDCFLAYPDGGRVRNTTNLPSPETPDRGVSRPLWDSTGRLYFIHQGALWRTSPDGEKGVKVSVVPGREIIQLIPQSRNVLWTVDGGRATIVSTHDSEGEQDGFYEIDLTNGKSRKLFERGQCYTCVYSRDPFVVMPDGRGMLYFAEDAAADADLWISDTEFKNPRQLTHLNPTGKYKMGQARLIDWLSDDGRRIRGTVLLPPNYEKGKRYPLIVWVYGGNPGSDAFDHFALMGPGPFNMQLFATRGYAVLDPDAPQHLATPMIDLAKTVLPGVNKVIELGIADPDRLGLMGHSYGGYSVLGLLVQTERFKAAMVADGIADLVSAYGAMDTSGAAFGTSTLEQGQGLMGGTPWDFRDRYIENSPIFYLDRVKTPLLIIHGGEDKTAPAFLGDELFVGLRRLGKKVEYARYQGEGHSPAYWSYANQVDFSKRVIAWFDAHLKTPTK